MSSSNKNRKKTPSGAKGTYTNTGQSGVKRPTTPLSSKGVSSAATPNTGAVQSSAKTVDKPVTSTPETKRDARRDMRKAEFSQKSEARRKVLQKAKRREQLTTGAYFAIGAIVVVIVGIWLFKMISAPSVPVSTSLTGIKPANGYAAGIPCQTSEGTVSHYHTHLQLVFNGKNEAVPADVGIDSQVGCLYWLHTHDASGIIHIESPNKNAQYLLGDFLAIWAKNPSLALPEGKPVITATQFFGQPVDKNHVLTVYINGKVFTGDPNTLVLQSGENIALEYGTPLVKPVSYDFAGNGVSP